MERLFKKSFRFAVDNYEEWENQKCKSKGDLDDAEIIACVHNNTITFRLFGLDDLDIEDTITMDLNSPYTRMLVSNGSPVVNEDRIQYFGETSFNPFQPHICQLFCEYGRISFVRFAFPELHANDLIPLTKRIYEFYGDMIELDNLTEEAINKVGDRFANSKNSLCQAEKYVRQAMEFIQQREVDGDEVYHPLYMAWREFQGDPKQLSKIIDYASFGSGMLRFLLFDTIKDIDIKQQVASIVYLFLSKALKDNPYDSNVILNRLIMIQHAREAFQYTVSSVVNENRDWYTQTLFPFISRDALYKMEYADLASDNKFRDIDLLNSRRLDLEDKIQSGFFGSNDSSSIIFEGKQLHTRILNYLENKVLKEHDIEF